MGVRVLVVDDNATIRNLLRTLLELDDRLELVGEAADADEALALVGERFPDVIVLDHMMPGRTGLEALPALRLLAPGARVVVYSATHDLRERALSHGADAFVGKDGDMGRLLDVVNELAAA